MRMKTLFFSFLTLLCLSSFGQGTLKPASITPPTVHVFRGYVIKVSSNAEGRYTYEILQQGKLVVNQARNPLNPSVSGLATTEDAFKVAQWQVQQLSAGAPSSFVIGQLIPQAVALQLNISTK